MTVRLLLALLLFAGSASANQMTCGQSPNLACLLGIPGGQTLNGGTAMADNITILPNTVAPGTNWSGTTRGLLATERVTAAGGQSTYTVSAGNFFAFKTPGLQEASPLGGTGTTITLNNGATYVGFSDYANLVLGSVSSPVDGPFGFVTKKIITGDAHNRTLPDGAFAAEDEWRAPSTKTWTLGGALFRDTVLYSVAGVCVGGGNPGVACVGGDTTCTGGGTCTGSLGTIAGTHIGFLQGLTIMAGVALPNVFGVDLQDALAGTGTITNYTGVRVGNITVATGTKVSYESVGANFPMQIAGSGVFGADAAPTNASTGLEVQSTTKAFLLSRMTTGQRDTMTAVAVANGMELYNSSLPSPQARVNGAWVNYADAAEVEIDFGSSPLYTQVFTVTDTSVVAASKVMAVQSGNAATGRQADENEMDRIAFAAQPAAGSFTLYATALNGPVTGKFRVMYAVN